MILVARVTSQQHRRIFQLCGYFDTRKCGNILNASPSVRTNQRKTTKSRLIRYIDKANKNISMRRSASHYARKLIGPIRVTLIDIHDSMSSLLRGAHTWSCQNVKAEPRRNSIRRILSMASKFLAGMAQPNGASATPFSKPIAALLSYLSPSKYRKENSSDTPGV